MELFITIEAQKATEIGLADILRTVKKQLSFVTDKELKLTDTNNYGTEFRLISIIPTCVDEKFWNILGWKERTQIWRKKKEADIRLRMDYDRFINETPDNKLLMFIGIIIKSIEVVQSKSLGDFKGQSLIDDILKTFNITAEQLENFK